MLQIRELRSSSVASRTYIKYIERLAIYTRRREEGKGIVSRQLRLSADYTPIPSVSPPLFKNDGDGDTGEYHFPLSRPSQEFSTPSAEIVNLRG